MITHKTVQHANADVFTAIAHPVRRQILDLLVNGEQPVKQLAERFTLTRPAISQHLRVLLDTGLVAEHRVGRENRYQLRAERLREVDMWLRHYERFWPLKLQALGTYLDNMQLPEDDL